MGHTVSLIAALHNSMNDYAMTGLIIIVMLKKGIGHKKLIASVGLQFLAHGIAASVVGLDLYFWHFSVADAIMREVAATVSTASVCIFGAGIADVIQTARISQTQTEHIENLRNYLDEEQNRRFCQIETKSKQQIQELYSLLGEGR